MSENWTADKAKRVLRGAFPWAKFVEIVADGVRFTWSARAYTRKPGGAATRERCMLGVAGFGETRDDAVRECIACADAYHIPINPRWKEVADA